MSRIIIKNIPNGFDEAKLRNHFSTCGIITDVQLKYTPEGKFRNFGFIGYENEDQASKAIEHFNNSFIRTSRISVAPCVALSETKNLKVWSKHSKQSEEVSKPEKAEAEVKEKKQKAKPLKAKDVLEGHEKDPLFKEYLEAHKRAGNAVWDNQFQQTDAEAQPTRAKEEGSVSEDSAIEPDKSPKATESKKPPKERSTKPQIQLFVAKLLNVPRTVKRQEILRFFHTGRPHSVRIPPKQKGFAYVGFKTEAELKKGLLMDKSFLGGKQVRVLDFTERSNEHASNKTDDKRNKQAKWERQMANQPSETICESGKLFFRNLSYSVKEEDIRELFEKYGPVSEVDVPIDAVTRKVKGFGTATFLMPEHAVTAYNELNGTFLKGRMFHILPFVEKGKEDEGSKDKDNDEADSSNYKQKKEKKLKETAQSSHNWNSLFINENAIAEAMAQRYSTSKEQVLDATEGGADGATSLAVRLALGETELVLEVQNFLQENGIHLDAFNATNAKRSSTVILVKNIPAGCTTGALRKLFAPFGVLGRIVLPPSAVTAVVEFLEPSEARKAFKKLAYTMFQSLPLYLEWAPENTFKTPPTEKDKHESNDTKTQEPSKVEPEVEAKDEPEADDTEPEEGTTLFIKNLSFTTDEEAIRERFRNVGPIHSVQIVRSKDLSGTGKNESRGYGFIQFKLRKSADHALKNMQYAVIDGRTIELARSDRTLKTAYDGDGRKKVNVLKQTGSKIVVRNIPFQANVKEVRDLFKVFGDIQSIRLPKKMAAGADESHRGFAFVEFVREPDAKRAFDALSRSTHLYGRRLVLEWAAPDDGVETLRKRTAEQFGSSEAGAPKRAHKGAVTAEQFVSAGAQQDDNDDDDE